MREAHPLSSHSSMMLSKLDFSLVRESTGPHTTKNLFTSLGQPRFGAWSPYLVAENMHVRGFGRSGARLLSERDKKGKTRPKERRRRWVDRWMDATSVCKGLFCSSYSLRYISKHDLDLDHDLRCFQIVGCGDSKL